MFERKLRMGMIGGGEGAFIGTVHRMAAELDGLIELRAGAFSQDPNKSLRSGQALFLEPTRIYGSAREMIENETHLPDSDRIDFVSIVTPNSSHFELAKLCLENGFSVMLEKPMTVSVEQALELSKIVEKSLCLFGLAHTYVGYPMVKQARDLVSSGKLGEIRKIVVQYPQGWLSTALEQSGQKQAQWRTDPKLSGPGGCLGDIGTHAFHLAEFVSGLRVSQLSADLHTFVEGRRLDDDVSVLLRFNNGARGVLMASQVMVGEANGLNIRVYGEKGGLSWRQEDPNELFLNWLDEPAQILKASAGDARLGESARYHLRLPGGHPEGYIEAFANLYRSFAIQLMCQRVGERAPSEVQDLPGVVDGVRTMNFVQSVIQSSQSSEKWTDFPSLNN